jgi:hypothetical protein
MVAPVAGAVVGPGMGGGSAGARAPALRDGRCAELVARVVAELVVFELGMMVTLDARVARARRKADGASRVSLPTVPVFLYQATVPRRP